MALALDPGIFRGAVHSPHRAMGRPANTSLTAWEFADKVVKYALDRGRQVAVYRKNGAVLMALQGTKTFDEALGWKTLIGVYDADCLVRDLRDDLQEYFKC